jgi:hypothetical protein
LHHKLGDTGCAHRKNHPVEGVEAEVWQFVSGLLRDPERLREGLDEMIERERAGMHGDPAQEQKMWLDKLADVERKRSGFQDMAAEGLITFDELRAKLAALEETRTTAQRELEALAGRRERLADFERDRDTLLEHYATMVPEALEELTAEERHQVYKMLRLEVYIHPDGDLEIRGVLSQDVLYPDGNVSASPQPSSTAKAVEASSRTILLTPISPLFSRADSDLRYTSVHKPQSLRSSAAMFLAFLSMPRPVNLHELAVIFPSRIDDAFPRDTLRAESSHEGIVLAPEHNDVRVRLVQVVVKPWEQTISPPHTTHRPYPAGTSTTKAAERSPPGDRPARTADAARRRSAPLRPHTPLRRSGPRSCPPCLAVRRSGGDRLPLPRCRRALLRTSVLLPPCAKEPLEPKRARLGAELALTSNAIANTHEALHRCNAPVSSEKYIGHGSKLAF